MATWKSCSRGRGLGENGTRDAAGRSGRRGRGGRGGEGGANRGPARVIRRPAHVAGPRDPIHPGGRCTRHHRLQALRRILRSGRDLRAAPGGSRHRRRPALWPRSHRNRLRSTARRRHRHLSRVHGHRTRGHPRRGNAGRCRGRLSPCSGDLSRAVGRPLARAPRVRKHLCHRRPPRDRRAVGARDAERSGARGRRAPGRLHTGLHRALGWAAGTARRLWLPGSRSPAAAAGGEVRGAGRIRRRRHRRVLDGWADRAL